MNTLTGNQVSDYAHRLYRTWIVDARVAIDSLQGTECNLRGNILVAPEHVDLMSHVSLDAIRDSIIEMVKGIWCNSHAFSEHIMVGLVLDTGGRPQLMMWASATPRKSVIREQRN